MKSLPRSVALLLLGLESLVSRRRLERLPERQAVTTDSQAVEEYDRAWYTKTAVPYVAWFQILEQILGPSSRPSPVLDLGCGPGHFTVAVAAHLGVSKIDAVDLSAGMIDRARTNAAQAGVDDRVSFLAADASRLPVEDDRYAATISTHLLHQFPTEADLRRQLREIDRVTKPDGIVFLADLKRLKTDRLTKRLFAIFGSAPAGLGVARHLDDFRSSLYASWSEEELIAAVPRPSRRRWMHLAPALAPGAQILVGLPPRRPLFLARRRPARQSPLIEAWRPKWETKMGRAWTAELLADISIAVSLFRLARARAVR